MRIERAVPALVAVVALAAGAWALARHGPDQPWLPGCLFHRFTGLHCAGCGMTRAAHALLHGEWAAAFRFNPLGLLLLPVALAGVAVETAGWVRGRALPVRISPGARGGWILLALLAGFWILRNIPQWPFTLLAPP